jgi:hypothetical protein
MTPSMQRHYAPTPSVGQPDLNPPEYPEAPEPSLSDWCSICDKHCHSMSADEDWRDDDDQPLEDARYAPNGKWVCSRRCFSDAMYRAADKATQRKLDAIADAAATLTECLDPATRELLNAWAPGGIRERMNTPDRLLSEADGLCQLLSAQFEPDWLDRPTREETLERAIGKATRSLKLGAMVNARCAVEGYAKGYRQQCSLDYLANDAGETAANLAEAIVSLEEAVQQ